MNQSIRARALTNQELDDKLFRKSKLGPQVATLGRSVSIMGLAHDRCVSHLNIDLSAKWAVDCMGVYDGPTPPAAKGGQVVPVLWGTSDAFAHLRLAAENQHIPLVCGDGLMYFNNSYENAFIEGFSYVDLYLHRCCQNASFLSRFFGGGMPAWNSNESKAIQGEVCRILSKATGNRKSVMR